MKPKQPAVYIMASSPRGTLYIGITGWLKHRVWEHREGLISGFTKAHRVNLLVWFELFADFPAAIKRETQLKKWNRAWKLELIEEANSQWHDLWCELNE